MLVARFYILQNILLLIAFISFATADPVCHPDYGQPTYTDCVDLVNALRLGSDDQRLLFFALLGEKVPPWIPNLAKKCRSRLPLLLTRG